MARLTDRLDMTTDVDWDIKRQTKQKERSLLASGDLFRPPMTFTSRLESDKDRRPYLDRLTL